MLHFEKTTSLHLKCWNKLWKKIIFILRGHTRFFITMEYLPHFVFIWSQFIRFPGCCIHAPGVFRQLWVQHILVALVVIWSYHDIDNHVLILSLNGVLLRQSMQELSFRQGITSSACVHKSTEKTLTYITMGLLIGGLYILDIRFLIVFIHTNHWRIHWSVHIGVACLQTPLRSVRLHANISFVRDLKENYVVIYKQKRIQDTYVSNVSPLSWGSRFHFPPVCAWQSIDHWFGNDDSGDYQSVTNANRLANNSPTE